MAFDDVRLPEFIERGSTGGPKFKTTVVPLDGGFEQRNQDWQESRGEWQIGYGIEDEVDFHALRDFFYGRRGRANGFLFKDWADFRVGENLTTQVLDPALRIEIDIAIASQVFFQAIKIYTFGAISFNRTIVKIVSGSDRFWIDDVEKTRVASPPSATEYSIDINTGLFETGDTMAGGESIESVFDFNVPVRFNTDHFKIRSFQKQAATIPRMGIVETRDFT